METDPLSLYELSVMCRKRAMQIREALQQRHVFSVNHVTIRLHNAYDWRYRLMAKIKSSKGKDVSKAEFKGFFNYDFTVEEKEACKVFIRNDEEISLLIEQAVAGGYKLTVTHNSKNDTYQAAMQCMDVEDSNAGLVMNAFAKHWYDALAVLMFKHFIVLQQNWSKQTAEGSDSFG